MSCKAERVQTVIEGPTINVQTLVEGLHGVTQRRLVRAQHDASEFGVGDVTLSLPGRLVSTVIGKLPGIPEGLGEHVTGIVGDHLHARALDKARVLAGGRRRVFALGLRPIQA